MMDNTFNIVTFGCQMNVRDSHWLAAALEKRGFMRTDAANARVIVINTCSVRDKPEKKLLHAVKRLHHLAGGNPDALVAVTGCVAQQLGDKIFEFSPLVRLVAGTDAVSQMPDMITRLLEHPDERALALDFYRIYQEREDVGESYGNACAMVNIMQGCDNFCSYCIVPFTRGRQKSRQLEAIARECGQLLKSGVKEITLLGQNVNAWGKDNGEGGFAGLLRRVAELPGLERLRFVTPHPGDMDDETVELFASLPNLCPRIHLPLQSGSDKILKSMRRRYDGAEFLRLVEKIRTACPQMAFSTDLIVGFPGETEDDFSQTLEMMRACGFMSSFSFCYSDRPGTRSAIMPGKVPAEVMLERLSRLQKLQDELTNEWLGARVGSRTEILIEGRALRDDGEMQVWQGRDPWDVVVNAPMRGNPVGRIIPVEITEAKRHTLRGQEIVDECRL